MKTNQYRSQSVAAAVAATIVSTLIVASLVESFKPAQLLRYADDERQHDCRPEPPGGCRRLPTGLGHARKRCSDFLVRASNRSFVWGGGV